MPLLFANNKTRNKQQMKSLLRDITFVRLLFASIFSVFGSSITFVALPIIAVVTLDVKASQMGWLAAFATIPFLFLGPFVGVIADRVRRKNIMILADLFRAVILMVIPMAYYLEILSIEMLFFVAISIGIGDVWFDISHGSYLPTVISKEKLLDAHSKLEMGNSGAKISGPALTGIVIHILGAPIALVIDSITYIFSAILLASIKIKEPKPEPEPSNNGGTLMLKDMKEGIKFIINNPLMNILTIRLGVWHFIFGGVMAILVLYLIQGLGFSATNVGFLFSTMGVGVFIGSLIAPKLSDKFGIGNTIILSNFLAPLSLLFLILSEDNCLVSMVMVSFAFLLFGMTSINFQINNASLRQVLTPKNMLGRMGATTRAFTLGLNSIGALSIGYIADLFSLKSTLVVLAVAAFLFGILGIKSPLTTVKTMPERLDRGRDEGVATSL
jgi:MFS family permease